MSGAVPARDSLPPDPVVVTAARKRAYASILATLFLLGLAFGGRALGGHLCDAYQLDEDGDHAEYLGWTTPSRSCVNSRSKVLLLCHDTTRPNIGFFPVRDPFTGYNLPMDWSCRDRMIRDAGR